MSKNKAMLSLIAFATYMIMSGLLTQIGVILNDFASGIGSAPEDAVAVFSFLTGGALIGTFVSLGLYSRLKIGIILKCSYGVFIVVMAILISLGTTQSVVVKACLLILGICCGCGLSGGAVIISKIYEDTQRASAFIVTDCSFSAAGFIFPSVAIYLLSQNFSWIWSYAAVGAFSVVLFAILFWVKYPETEASLSNSPSFSQQIQSILRLRVILMAIGVCLYLIAQTTFLTWAPNYLQFRFALSESEASAVVGNYWGFSIFGLLSAAIIIHKIKPRIMLLSAVSIAVALNAVFLLTESAELFLILSFAFGFCTTCIYKIAMAVGSQQIKNAPATLVTFLLFSGGLGSTLAPALSGNVVSRFDESAAILMSFSGYISVLLIFTLCLMFERQAHIKRSTEN